MTRGWSLSVWILGGLSWLLPVTPLAARCTEMAADTVSFGETIRLVPSTPLPARIVDRAIELWESCPNYGTGFPSFVTREPATRDLFIEYYPREVGSDHCGRFLANSIVLYGWIKEPDGQISRCGDLGQNLAHELGHALGLADAPEERTCERNVMSWLNRHNRSSRRVTVSECLAAGQRWLTFEEWAAVPASRQVELAGFSAAGGR